MTINEAIDSLVMAQKILRNIQHFGASDQGGFFISIDYKPDENTVCDMESNGWIYDGLNEIMSGQRWIFWLGD